MPQLSQDSVYDGEGLHSGGIQISADILKGDDGLRHSTLDHFRPLFKLDNQLIVEYGPVGIDHDGLTEICELVKTKTGTRLSKL